MILNELTLTNFGIYKGEHKVTLTPDNKKPIILFGAYNGSGKTTFLDALQLVLYGKSAKTSGRVKMAYDDYLRLLINRDISPKIGAGLTLSFTTLQNGKKEKIEVSRTWAELGNSIKEHCEVKRNDVFDQVTSDRWSEFVEEFMPSEISELFFFDGEKIEGLADPVTSSNFIKSGIYSLLGINSIENLMKSLTQIEKRKATEISENSSDISLEIEEKTAKELSQKREKYAQERSSLRTDLDKIINEIGKSEEDMRSSGANLFENRHKLQEKLSVLGEKKTNITTELIDLAAARTPLLLLEKMLFEIKSDLKKSSGHSQKSVDLFKIEIQMIKGTCHNEDQLSVIRALDARIKVLTEEVEKNSLDIELSAIPTNEELSELRGALERKIKDSENIDDEIDNTSKNLMAVPSEDKIKDIVTQLNKHLNEKIRIETKIEAADQILSEISSQQDKVSKEISSKLAALASQQTGLIESQRILKHSQKSKETLSKFKNELIQKHLSTLSQEITTCFKDLQRKTKFNLSFDINQTNFSLIIKKLSGEEISAKTLSAGERQLLAVAILWALARSSGKILPTVIDTPLGRLDMPHRQKLLNNYFPKASNQVLIFATDAEISNDQYAALKPFISREYTINYDESSESSKFVNNYFSDINLKLETV